MVRSAEHHSAERHSAERHSTAPLGSVVRGLALVSLLVVMTAVAAAPASAEQRLGVGLHYYRAIDDLADDGFDDIDQDGLAGIISYQFVPGGLISFGIDLEIYPDGFGGSTETSFAPIGWVFIGGSGLYAGAGIGITIAEDFESDTSDPFYVGRIGYDLELIAGVRIDVNLNYRADAFSELDDASTDAITAGAVIRFTF
ncbi:MAG: hypothetical protein AAGD38_09900 [Acidobacteriota bacterium]